MSGGTQAARAACEERSTKMNETTTTPFETTTVAAPSRRRVRGFAATLIGVLAMTVGLGAVAPATHAAVAPKYKIEAKHFKNIKETNEASASDEVYWHFSSVTSAGTATTRTTAVDDNIDAGETHGHIVGTGANKCMFGTLSGTGSATTCLGKAAPTGIGMSVQAWEEDHQSTVHTLIKTAEAFRSAGPYVSWIPEFGSWIAKAANVVAQACTWLAKWFANDAIGSQTFSYSAATLAARLPAVGRSFEETRRFSGGGAVNDLTYIVTRVA
jgi:hypothetical protein